MNDDGLCESCSRINPAQANLQKLMPNGRTAHQSRGASWAALWQHLSKVEIWKLDMVADFWAHRSPRVVASNPLRSSSHDQPTGLALSALPDTKAKPVAELAGGLILPCFPNFEELLVVSGSLLDRWRIDFENVQHLLMFCTKHHAATCDQSNAPVRHALIQSMNHIYEGAEITIIDAAGSNPDFGLPGVSAPRLAQTSVKIRRSRFVAVPNSMCFLKICMYQI
ncbi:uncharacterized protein BCR38DRAFT_485030 [Pseudomassariella vexata]|uniref:Uncharacterized protein n=1 Tax=Pseudomassariella vexata TaxID=1141098 RepID=A0A1Y2DX79_9PEZI|nr:uncharacterized protein BCR38DRAFT_485030 [Pseudomassariella vexata]ORY63881.1 hypothetical protein BCR38DRAFT_485030 [Pseudomassariella vexata]